jgi:hypothetical protein
MALTISLTPDMEAQLRNEASRRGVAPDAYAVAALRERLRQDQNGPRPLPGGESSLIAQINQGLAEEKWERYGQLVAKREAETLGEQEHKELLGLSHQIEMDNARRMELLIKLAQLRDLPLETLMRQLGIEPRRHWNSSDV